MIFAHFLSALWHSEPFVNKLVIFLDYAGILDTISAVILFIIWIKKPKKAHERRLSLYTILLSFFAGVFWVADSNFNHRLTSLQSKTSESALLYVSNQVSAIRAKYNEATNAQAIAERAARRAEAAAGDAANQAENLSRANAKVGELDAKMHPRIITDEQRKKFINLMAKIPKGKIDVEVSLEGGAEADAYARQIQQMITEAGYETRFGSTLNAMANGVFFGIKDTNNPPVFAGEVEWDLNAIGIDIKGFVDATAENGIQIIVGPKP